MARRRASSTRPDKLLLIYVAIDRIDHRRKLKQHAVSRGLHEASPVLRHESIGDLAVFAEGAGGADLVEAHEARVARDVGRDYGGEPASDASWLVLLHKLSAHSGNPAFRRPSINSF